MKSGIDITRRDFLKTVVGLAAAMSGLEMIAGCATFDPRTVMDSKKFDIQSFTEWYSRNRLYNKANPNLEKWSSRQRMTLTYQQNIDAGYTPGVSFGVRKGEIMIAVAPGEVTSIGELPDRPGRHAGLMILVDHPDNMHRVYQSAYAHLDDSLVKPYQLVNRGDKIGRVFSYPDTVKLFMKERSLYADPDNYGVHHSFMDHFGFSERPEKTNQVDMKRNQEQIIDALKDHFVNYNSLKQKNYFTYSHSYYTQNWSNAELIKYFETLYAIQPQQLPKLPKQEFEKIKTEFYANQPIILTLPFKKS